MPPTTSLMAAARSTVSLPGHVDPEQQESDPFIAAERTIGALPSLLLYWYHFHADEKKNPSWHRRGLLCWISAQIDQGDHPSKEEIRAMNISLILYAEHEFNASTFTVRTIASTLSDTIQPLRRNRCPRRPPSRWGQWSSLRPHYLFFLSGRCGIWTPKKAGKKRTHHGFGHRVYTTNDPRSDLIYKEAKKLARLNIIRTC